MEEKWIVRVVFASAPLVGRVWTVQVNNIKKADGFSFFIKLYNNLIQQNTSSPYGEHFRHPNNNDALRCLRFECFIIQIFFSKMRCENLYVVCIFGLRFMIYRVPILTSYLGISQSMSRELPNVQVQIETFNEKRLWQKRKYIAQ